MTFTTKAKAVAKNPFDVASWCDSISMPRLDKTKDSINESPNGSKGVRIYIQPKYS
jgi:hypothetical protein